MGFSSDTMPACYYVQHHLNGGKPAGVSVPATEHSVMTSFPHEQAAFAHMIEKYQTKEEKKRFFSKKKKKKKTKGMEVESFLW